MKSNVSMSRTAPSPAAPQPRSTHRPAARLHPRRGARRWFLLRVVFYGYVNYALTVMYLRERCPPRRDAFSREVLAARLLLW